MTSRMVRFLCAAPKQPAARRSEVIVLKAITLLVILAAILAMGVTVANAQSRPVKDINTFVDCLNGINRANGTVADALRCVPQGCYFTVTMSTFSGQRACSLEGSKLPRVIFSCPGPADELRFRPSFTLCPNDMNRVELGEDVDSAGRMKMGDVDIPPGTDFTSITEDDVFSRVNTGNSLGTKRCNACHGSGGALDGNQLSLPIDPFGFFFSINLAPFVIDTNEPGMSVDPSVRTSLAEVCSSIASNGELASDPSVDWRLLTLLCARLNAKTSGQ